MLGALSLILNGGGVAQLKTIAQELNKAVTGREDNVRSVLSQIDTFTGSLDTNKAQIVDAIEALNRLALSAHQQEGNIDEALEELPSALTSIDGQREDLVRMLQALDQLSGVGRPRDQGVEDRDHRLAAPAAAGAQPARRLRRRLRQGVQRLPDLPVRRRGRRPRPAGGPQPAHGRLHQPVDHPRRRPDQGACRPTRPTCCRPSSTRASWSRTSSTASPAATSPAPRARRCSTRPRRCSSSRRSARSPPTGTRPCASLLNTVPGLPAAARWRAQRALPRLAAHGPAQPAASSVASAAAAPVRGTTPRTAGRPWPSSRRSTTRRWSTCWCPSWSAPRHRTKGGATSDHPPYQGPADGLRGDHAARRARSSARATRTSTGRSTTTTTR